MFFFKKNYESININEVNNLDKPNLVDIRFKDEFKSGTIKNAKNIEMDALISNPDKYLNKNEKYYIFCTGGMRSRFACNELSKAGYNVVNLSGGISQYKG